MLPVGDLAEKILIAVDLCGYQIARKFGWANIIYIIIYNIIYLSSNLNVFLICLIFQ